MAEIKVKLVIVQGKPAGKRLNFPPGDYFIGRGAECHVRPDSEWVSRQHCLLRVTGDSAFIRDLGSRNGTLVNGQLVEAERGLAAGDQVQIGPLVFEVLFEEMSPTPTVADTINKHVEETAQIEPSQAGTPPAELEDEATATAKFPPAAAS